VVRLALLPLVVGLALVVAGCGGGGSSDESSPADWASGVCTALTDWTNSVKAAGNSLRGNISKDGVKTAASDIEDASKSLESDLRGLGKPNTDSGQDAKDAVNKLADNVDDDVSELKDTVDNISGPGDVAPAVQSVSATVSKMASQIGSTAQTLDQVDPGGELQQAFRNSSECKQLTSSAS
jgi:methyl-accepting chemotaxis protein